MLERKDAEGTRPENHVRISRTVPPHEMRLIREALQNLMEQRDRAEIRAATAAAEMRWMRETIVWKFGGPFRRFSRMAPRPAAYFGEALRLLAAILTFRLHAFRERRQANAALLNEDRALILASGLFDEEWYVNRYPDVAAGAMSPVDHYVRHGYADDRQPNACFQTRWYAHAHPGVIESRRQPLAHYITAGATLEFAPAPDFDPRWYRRTYHEDIPEGVSPLLHYLTVGRRKGYATEAAQALLADRR